MVQLSSIDCFSNFDDPVLAPKKKKKKVSINRKKKGLFFVQSVLLAAMSNALWHFPSNKIETI